MALFGTDADRFSTIDALSIVTSFDSSASGSQKNENSKVIFLPEGTGDVMIFDGEAT